MEPAILGLQHRPLAALAALAATFATSFVSDFATGKSW
jgi:hypothetical protein